MTSYNGKQIITIHILPNVLRSKDNQLIEYTKYNMRNISIQRQAENEARILVTDLFLFFKKKKKRCKQGISKWSAFSFNIYW